MLSHLQELLERGFFRTSSSPQEASFLFLKKKDGSIQMHIDYWVLNKVSLINKYTLARIDYHFSKIDLCFGYHQVQLFERDVPKTIFMKHFRHYDFLAMSFGLPNALAIFVDLIRYVVYFWTNHLQTLLMTSLCLLGEPNIIISICKKCSIGCLGRIFT